MAQTMQVPELQCLDPENYRKYFRTLCWSGTRKYEKKVSKKGGKKEKSKRLKLLNTIAVCYAPALLANASQFAVYATVRRSILARWRNLQGHFTELSDDSDDDAPSQTHMAKLPKITGIGLRTIFALISQARSTDSQFCEYALKALLDVLQGHSPEELAQEPAEMISNLQGMLVDVASCSKTSNKLEVPSNITALSSSSLIALSVARGEAELILSAVASLIISPPTFSEQNIQIPLNLTSLQRSVQSVIVGPPSRNQWSNCGVPHQSLVTSFPVDLPSQLTSGTGDLVIRSLVSDGCYIYIFTSRGLLKIGSGYGSSIKQHMYLYKPDFFASDRHGWLGYCRNKLYVRIGRKKTEVFEVDKNSLEVRNVLKLEPGQPTPIEPKSAVFSDGNQLGLIVLTNFDSLTIKMYDIDVGVERKESPISLSSRKEINVHLLRRRTLIIGRAPFDESLTRRSVELDTPVAVQLEDSDEDPLTGLYSGQDFGLLTTQSGKVFYTGKSASLGYKLANVYTNRWTLMKEAVFTRNDTPNAKKCKVIQVAVGHEGVHAVMVLDNGTALFTGVARRGEDGDTNKHRRTPKPTRLKKIFKAEGHYIVYAACNYGSTALVTRQGLLLMFGKDTQHCDTTGVVVGLRHERVIQVALGKAHAVALTSFGLVYTFGINNKGQCGREFGYTKERSVARRHSGNKEDVRICPTSHTWTTDYCRVCVLCRECTGFATCQCANLPNRVPGEKCGCGEGDSGCSVCGVCRRCADVYAAGRATDRAVVDLDDDADASTRSDSKSDKESTRYSQYETHTESEGSGVKVTCLPPARVAVPGGHRIGAVACGLHHTVLLTENGDVLTFGSNQFGQLGAGDVCAHHRIVRVRVPRASAVAAGSNHTAVLTRDGELYTFGSYQKGSLGRPRIEESARTDRCPIWYAVPGRVPRIGPRYASKAVWVCASGDQTFVQVSQALIKTETLFSSTITANSNSIIILPNRPEHTFKCITINKNDGACNAWTGPEQVDFVNTLASLDPLYDVLWCYQPQMRVMKCYNILTFDCHQLQRCCKNNADTFSTDGDFEYPNYGYMKRLEDFKNLENFDLICNGTERQTDNVALSNMSVLNQELAIPSSPGCFVTRMHAALHLLGCLDSLIYAHDLKPNQEGCKRENTSSPVAPLKEDFLTVNRFESHGGGWGYSGHSVEAIRFMCDTDILLGGYGLFGGRGDYTAKIKLFDIGTEGGDQEGDGELIAESDEIVYECAPRDRFPVLFDQPVPLVANRWYVAWACINGPSSDCGSSGQAMVINDEIGFHFKTSKKSNNGTDVNAGQIPCLLYNTVSPDQTAPVRSIEPGDSVIHLSKNISRKVTVPCFRSLITLLQWSWTTLKGILLDTNGQIPINYQKLTVMKHQKRLVYVIRACLRLVKSYINEIYPQDNKKRNSHEYMSYFEAIADVRNLIQGIMADQTPTCSLLPKKPGKNKTHRVCYVQFALELTNSILKEAHETIISCFHAFFPTPTLKWNHFCSLLLHVKDGVGVVPPSQIRELSATCAAMCASRSLRDVLQYIVPVTQNYVNQHENRRPDSKINKDAPPSKSATIPRSSHAQKPPPVPPRANIKEFTKPTDQTGDTKSNNADWHLLDVIPKLLDIVMMPIKQQMMTRQCGQPHDHGEIKQNECLSEFCCKLITRIVAELAYSATHIREDHDPNTIKHLITPSRFMRVNQSRAWNTGNGSPDAICFTVDRPGIILVGVCVYGGLGNYEYSLELLHDVRVRSGEEDLNTSHCWVSEEVAHGVFSAADCQHDMAQLKFDRPVPLKPFTSGNKQPLIERNQILDTDYDNKILYSEDLRYAVRLCNHGGRTANGDCGLPSVKGPDDTTFRFSSCSLSFNGTTLARGQIPCLIYYGTSKAHATPESTDSLISALRSITLRVASIVIERAAELFCNLRNELTSEDLRRNATVLQQSPVINTLIPFTLANLEGLDDSKCVIKILEMIHKLLPHVTAMNLLIPSVEESAATVSQYYTWLESDHPYKQAAVTNMRVLFPSNVSWIVLEMDPRSITAQPEDTLTVYAVAGAPKHRCHCSPDVRSSSLPFRKRLIQLTSETEVEDIGDEGDIDTQCAHYNCTYVSVTPRLGNVPSEWPQKALLVPGNEVIFSLETASDYLNDYNKTNNEESRYGFRCLVMGYEDASFTSQRQGLVALEMELVYSGAACASRLLAPDLDIPPLTFSTLVEVQVLAMMGTSPTGAEGEASQDASEALLLSRGLELSSPPSIHQVLEGQPLIRCISTEKQFLSDFVAGAESTAGGRLARWLAPTSQVEPSRCELKPPATAARPAARVNLPVIVRDQYGDTVVSPALKVEVVVQKIEEKSTRQNKRLFSSDDIQGNVPEVPYHTIQRDTMCFHAITMMKPYQGYSFEELRFASSIWGDSRSNSGNVMAIGQVPAERLSVRAQPDGTYCACWTPRAPGAYVFRCTLDDQPAPQELTIEVAEGTPEGPGERVQTSGDLASTPPSKLRRFTAQFTAGLRVRASPSLQAEELGRVPPGADIAYVEELMNKDGTWVRLNSESVRTFAGSGVAVAWCMQYHRSLDRVLLVAVEPPSPPQMEYAGTWKEFGDSQKDLNSWTNDDEVDIHPSDANFIDDKTSRDDIDESDGSASPFVFGAEPSKRSRFIRNESSSKPSPKRLLRRTNGNSDEWWSPVKHRASDNMRDIDAVAEADVELESEERSSSRLAQTGTQTSPDSIDDEIHTPINVFVGTIKDGRVVPQKIDRSVRSRLRRVSPPPPPPLPARQVAAPPLPKKHALSPAQAECIRAIFAALLWHEGIVHDAIACAAFLKFHPHLPKQGARVVTRTPQEVNPNTQRHSVEVSNAGHYLRIHPSTLETLARSGAEASASRTRRNDVKAPIREEEGHLPDDAETSPSVVNVLPPALRALVALWDALFDADQLAVATDKLRRLCSEKNENADLRQVALRKKKDAKSSSSKAPYSVRCELCSGSGVPPPLVAHMRRAHPGCRAPAAAGYDRAGVYSRADRTPPRPHSCGQLAQAYQLWYIYCEKCREKTLKTSPSDKNKSKSIPELEYDRIEEIPEVDYNVMKENAVFLLDLAPLTNSEASSCSWQENGRSPPTSPGSIWQPAPPFQCLSALGVVPKAAAASDVAARYHSLGRPAPPAAAPLSGVFSAEGQVGGQCWRVHRSVSMGQAGERDLAVFTRQRPADRHSLTGAGSSLLAQPSAALQKLVGCGEWAGEGCTVSAFEPANVDSGRLMQSPVLSFILAKRDLYSYRQKLDAAVRINTVRQYAFEALNWLLRSATQPTCVHDVMWWFCSALDKYSRIVPPPLALEDNKENVSNEPSRGTVPTASASAILPGGRAARGSRAAFHSLLGSVSALAPSLPHASAAALQAVRCWALHYSAHDRTFLHRSQVFSVISKILSHSEDSACGDGVLGALHESFHSYLSKENFVWSCPDVTGWCDITVSSRQGMAGALTDGSTETFWESGDEDRNKAKWIQVSFPGGTPDDRPHIVCVHVDNTRDTVNKTLLVSFLYSGGASDMYHMQDIEVDPKMATWLCYTLPKVSLSSVRVRCELRGPEPAVRVRQVRVLSAPAPQPAAAPPPARILHQLIEADTLRVFRLLTSQVFGKLLEWDQNGSESNGDGATVTEETANDDSDLREHVVGILFSGHKLTSLQKQVMSHIVCAIGCEAVRVRDDWETALLCADTDRADRAEDQSPRVPHHQDNYCFEMLSLLLALSGSAVGRAHLGQRTELLADLLSLLHTGSERVQRQVISLLRRMITEIPPQKVFAAINCGNDLNARVTLLDHLVSYVGKAITTQVKVKGAGGGSPLTATMGTSVVPAAPAATAATAAPATWFMRGETVKKHAHLVAKLLADMAEGKVSPSWTAETQATLGGYVSALASIDDSERRPARCMAAPPVWMALAALAVCEQSHLELVNNSGDIRGSRGRDSAVESRPFCANHDDGSTVAVIECRSCGPLCAECDRFLHLNRTARTHHRQICKEEETAIRVDIHEGCGRAKLFWLLLLVDRRTLKALAEFRGLDNAMGEAAVGEAALAAGPPGLAGACRFCGTRGNSGLLAIGNVCADQQCQVNAGLRRKVMDESSSSSQSSINDSDDSTSPQRRNHHRKYVKPKPYRILSQMDGTLFAVEGSRVYPIVRQDRQRMNFAELLETEEEHVELFWKKKYEEEKIRADELARLLELQKRPVVSPILQSKTTLHSNIEQDKQKGVKETAKERTVSISDASETKTEQRQNNAVKIRFNRDNEIELECQFPHVDPLLEKMARMFHVAGRGPEPHAPAPAAAEKVIEVESGSGTSTPLVRDPEVSEKIKKNESEIFREIEVLDKLEQTEAAPTDASADGNVTKRKRGRPRKSLSLSISSPIKSSALSISRPRQSLALSVSSPKKIVTEARAASVDKINEKIKKAVDPKSPVKSDAEATASNTKRRSARMAKEDAIAEKKSKASLSGKSSKTTKVEIPPDDSQGRYKFPDKPKSTSRTRVANKKYLDYVSSYSKGDHKIWPSPETCNTNSLESSLGYQDSDASLDSAALRRKRRYPSNHFYRKYRKMRRRSYPYLADDDTCETIPSIADSAQNIEATQNTEATLNTDVYRSESYQLLGVKNQNDVVSNNRTSNQNNETNYKNKSHVQTFVVNHDDVSATLRVDRSHSPRTEEGNSSNISLPLSPELSVVENLSVTKEVLERFEDEQPTLNETFDYNEVQQNLDCNKYMMSEIDISLPLMGQECELRKERQSFIENLDPENGMISESLLGKICLVNLKEQSSSDSLAIKLGDLLLKSAKKMAQNAQDGDDLDKENAMEVDATVKKVKKTRSSKKRCSTPQKRVSKNAKVSVGPILEEHLETCSYSGRKSCPPAIKIFNCDNNVCDFDDQDDTVLDAVNTNRRGRKKKDIIKVKITRPKKEKTSLSKNNNIYLSEKETLHSSRKSVCTDSGINDESYFVQCCNEDSVELIHNHSETCLQTNECLGDSIEFIENKSKSIISIDSDSMTCEDGGNHTKAKELPEIFCDNAQDAGHLNVRHELNGTGSKDSTVYFTPPCQDSPNSLMTEDLSDEIVQECRQVRPGKWYICSDEETTTFLEEESPAVAGIGANLKQIFTMVCAVPNLSTITEASRENDSRKPTMETKTEDEVINKSQSI